jgi:predicted nucleotidyltransferase
MDALFKALPKSPHLQMIHAFYGGSSLHGAKLSNRSDTDIYGVFLEPADRSLGLDRYEHFITSSSGDGEKNTKDDVDITTYSLRMWAQQACKGNPTALQFLFAPNGLTGKNQPLKYYDLDVYWDTRVSEMRRAVACKKAGKAFLGFANDQMRRLAGVGTGRHGQRKPPVPGVDYDTKATMHVFRLLSEGIEFMETGKITYPRPDREFLLDVRQGHFRTVDAALAGANAHFHELEQAMEKSRLPEKADRELVSHLITRVYQQFYQVYHPLKGIL